METVLVEKKNINEVVELLKQDEVVAFPTETVFGLGVKFGNLSALEKIYEIKHRSHSKAVSLMIYDSQDIEKYVRNLKRIDLRYRKICLCKYKCSKID